MVVGESLLDVVVDQHGESSSAVGGSPMNVAVGLARLGVPTLLITQVGDDDNGRRVVEHVRASGADITDSSIQPGRRTSTAVARLGEGNAASYDFDLSWEPAHQDLPDAAGLHVGSLGASLAPGRAVVLGLARRAADRDLFLSYDPNIRSAFVGDDLGQAWRDVTEIASLSNLIKVSDEDLHTLRPDQPVTAVAHDLLAGERTELVIITSGGAGAAAITDVFEIEVSAPPVDVVDTVGAGDSFMAAVLALLLDWAVPANRAGGLSQLGEDKVRLLLEGAMAAAAVTCARRGANPPTRKELPTARPQPRS